MNEYFKPFKTLRLFILIGIGLLVLDEAIRFWIAGSLEDLKEHNFWLSSLDLIVRILLILLESIGGAILGAVAILFIIQLPVYESDITNFFKTAFTDLTFVSRLLPEIQEQILGNVLRSLYGKQCGEELLRQVQDILRHPKDSYYLKHDSTFSILVDKDSTEKRVQRFFEIKNNAESDVKLLEFLNKSTPLNIYLHGQSDTRTIESVTLSITGSTSSIAGLVDPDLCSSGVCSRYGGSGYSYQSTIDWTKLKFKNNPVVVNDLIVKPGSQVSLSYSEIIKTGNQDFEVSFRLRHFSKGLTVRVILENKDGVNRKLRGTIFGNILNRNEFQVQESGNMITCTTDRWLTPGNGYFIFHVPI